MFVQATANFLSLCIGHHLDVHLRLHSMYCTEDKATGRANSSHSCCVRKFCPHFYLEYLFKTSKLRDRPFFWHYQIKISPCCLYQPFTKSIKHWTLRFKITMVHSFTFHVDMWLLQPNSLSLSLSLSVCLCVSLFLSQPLSCQHEVIVWSKPTDVISFINKSNFLSGVHISWAYPVSAPVGLEFISECPSPTHTHS